MTDSLIKRGDVLLYLTKDGGSKVDALLDGGNIWMSQAAIAELFQTSVPNVSQHINQIYSEEELDESSTSRSQLAPQTTPPLTADKAPRLYSLQLILAISFRIQSVRGVQFRQWAVDRLNEYLVKGFVMDDERLKAGTNFSTNYFEELLERIRDIRASEKQFYQKIKDIYALAIDYNEKEDRVKEFFQTAQNKMLFAVTGKTAAELIFERSDPKKPNMGLTTWKGAVVRKKDVTIAKNYLHEAEISELNKIVVMFLDYAEDQTKQHKQIYTKDWQTKLDSFLEFNGRKILIDAGRTSQEFANRLANQRFDEFDFFRRNKEDESDQEIS